MDESDRWTEKLLTAPVGTGRSFLALASSARALLDLNPSSASSVLAIKDTINHYPLAIDSKNFSALSNIFTVDAIANYSPPLGVLSGLETIQNVLQSSLAPVTSQHGLSTQTVTLFSNTEANTTTYFTAQQFGMGIWEGQLFTSYGRYEDHLILTRDGWRIDRRHLIYMVGHFEAAYLQHC
ncbi:hypothetical protein C0995_004681 [Termitomyces sp. Mi166|nr:hypothetical protein C0995_004681 [Termitomyces sp. Mi166\